MKQKIIEQIRKTKEIIRNISVIELKDENTKKELTELYVIIAEIFSVLKTRYHSAMISNMVNELNKEKSKIISKYNK